MPPPILPGVGKFLNPFAKDASGRNVFQRGAEIAVDTIIGSGADVQAGVNVIQGKPAGEGGAITGNVRSGAFPQIDTKSVVVYGIALLFIIFGLRGAFTK